MVLAEEEALSRFREARIARLATVSEDGTPHLVPVTFAAWSTTVVIAIDHKPKTTTNLKRLANIRSTGKVSLLADEYDDQDWTNLWWVRVDGTARVIDPTPELTAHLTAKYPQYQETPPEGPMIHVHIDKVRSWTYSRR